MKPINDISKRQEESQNDNFGHGRKMSLFNNDIFKNPIEQAFFVFARKVEKVVTAIYLVTDVMDPDLPLTRSLRSESLELLNAFFQVLTVPALNPSDVRKIMVRMEHVTSLVSIGRIAHHVSEMNAEVLLQEMVRITDAVSFELSELSRQYSSYGHARHDLHAASQPVLSHQVLDDATFDEILRNRKRQNDIKTTLTTYQPTHAQSVGNRVVQNDTSNRLDKTKTTPVSTNTKSSVKVSLTSGGVGRRQEILNVLTSHSNATMQDVQKFVTGCSEKTLQREMASLILAGLVQKEGDKRWATYHVV